MAQGFARDPVSAARIVDDGAAATGALQHPLRVDERCDGARAGIDHITVTRRESGVTKQFDVAHGLHGAGLDTECDGQPLAQRRQLCRVQARQPCHHRLHGPGSSGDFGQCSRHRSAAAIVLKLQRRDARHLALALHRTRGIGHGPARLGAAGIEAEAETRAANGA